MAKKSAKKKASRKNTAKKKAGAKKTRSKMTSRKVNAKKTTIRKKRVAVKKPPEQQSTEGVLAKMKNVLEETTAKLKTLLPGESANKEADKPSGESDKVDS
jgi:hypothetical protein